MDIISTGNSNIDDMNITLSFNELLIKAAFHNYYELVKEMVEDKEFDSAILTDIGLLSVPFPLHYITMCFETAMKDDSFRDETMPFVREQRENINKLLELWKDKFNLDTVSPIDYKKYEEYFYCLADSEDFEDVFLYPIEKFKATGCRDIDLELYEAVDKFQFSKVEKLLKKGANPDADLFAEGDDEPCNCIDRISSECSYLCTCQIFSIIEKPHGNWYINLALNDSEIGDLIGWAAHEKMYRLLSKYQRNVN